MTPSAVTLSHFGPQFRASSVTVADPVISTGCKSREITSWLTFITARRSHCLESPGFSAFLETSLGAVHLRKSSPETGFSAGVRVHTTETADPV